MQDTSMEVGTEMTDRASGREEEEERESTQ